MSIAIFRNLKLYVAVPIQFPAPVSQFSQRRLQGIAIETLHNGEQAVLVRFNQLSRYRGRLAERQLVWQLQKDHFQAFKFRLIDHIPFSTKEDILFPAFTHSWTENGNDQFVKELCEFGVSSRIIVERYLHAYTADPFQYQIIEMDFRTDTSSHPQLPNSNVYMVRPLDMLDTLSSLDHSDIADVWAQLFLT